MVFDFLLFKKKGRERGAFSKINAHGRGRLPTAGFTAKVGVMFFDDSFFFILGRGV